MSNILKKVFLLGAGHSYTNLGRLFLRLFVGVMLMQFGIRQLWQFPELSAGMPELWGMTSQSVAVVMVVIEIACSAFIMFGFCTRIMLVPPMVAMVVAEWHLLTVGTTAAHAYLLSWAQQGYLPIMFLGIYFFLFLVGPGKISIDYFLSLHIIHTEDRSEEVELEEV